MKLRLFFTRTPVQIQGPRVLSRLTRPAWDAWQRTGTREDVATADGANAMLDTLAEAFQGEHETELFDALEDTFYGPGRKKGKKLHDYALRVAKQRTGTGQSRSTVARSGAGVSFVTPSKPEYSSPQSHHDISRITACQLVDVRKACKSMLMSFSGDPEGTRHTWATHSLMCHRLERQVLGHKNRKETLT